MKVFGLLNLYSVWYDTMEVILEGDEKAINALIWEIAVQNDVERRHIGWFVVNKEMVLTLPDFLKVNTMFRNSELFENMEVRKKKFVRQIRKEFCYTYRRTKESCPNSHMPFKILSFSLLQFDVSLRLDLSLETFQQIDLFVFFRTVPVLQLKSSKAALRKQLLLLLK